MKQLILFPKGQLSDADRKRIEKEGGAIAVEVDDPSAVVMCFPSVGIKSDVILQAALMGLSGSYATQERDDFAKALIGLLIK